MLIFCFTTVLCLSIQKSGKFLAIAKPWRCVGSCKPSWTDGHALIIRRQKGGPDNTTINVQLTLPTVFNKRERLGQTFRMGHTHREVRTYRLLKFLEFIKPPLPKLKMNAVCINWSFCNLKTNFIRKRVAVCFRHC